MEVRDLTKYANAAPSTTMEAFADYLIAKVYGGALPDGIEEVAFRKGVALGGSTRGYFQASPEWKADDRNYLANVGANAEKRATEKADRARIAREKAVAREEAAIAKLALAVEAAKARAAALAPEAVEEGSEEGSEIESLDATILPEGGRRGRADR